MHFIASAKSTIIRRPCTASQPTEIDCVNRWTEAEDDTQLAPLVVLNQLKFQTRVQESDLWQPDAMMGGKQSRTNRRVVELLEGFGLQSDGIDCRLGGVWEQQKPKAKV